MLEPCRDNGICSPELNNGLYHWKNYEKIVFRITFVFLLLMTIPTNLDWYVNTWNYDWSKIHWNMLYDISAAGRVPKFVTIATESGKWGIDLH